MKQTLKTLCIAALAVVGAMTTGCTSLEIPEQTGNEEEKTVIPGPSANSVTLITTITLGGNPQSKALSAAGVKTFAAGEQVAVIYEDENGNTQKAVSTALEAEDIHDEGKKADITVTLTDPAQNGALRYIYPAAMAKATIATDATIDDACTIDFTRLDAQDGTLATLTSGLDLAVFDGKFTAAAELPASATLENKFTIAEFTIKNYGGTDISDTITSLTVEDGASTYTVTRDAAVGPIYLVMIPVADAVIEFTASDGANTFVKSVTGKTLAANKIYPIGLRMSKLITLTSETGDVTLNDGDILTGTGGADTHVTIADGATIWLNGVTIVNTSGVGKIWSGLTCAGDATINLVDGTTNTVHGFYATCPGIYWPKDYTLTINGDTGSLTASCYDVYTEAATGIGSGDYSGYRSCGNIIINGGHITAIGSTNAAGIGSAMYCTCGDITINDGYVEASSWGDCPGIGSGCSFGSVTRCGDILIAGGTVIATGGCYAPGIGSGLTEGVSSSYKSICGTVTITAGITSVTAIRGGESPDVIGTARELSHNDTSLCGVITFGSQPMYDGSVWTTTPTNGSDYSGLHLVISRTNEDNDTWTLTPVAP